MKWWKKRKKKYRWYVCTTAYSGTRLELFELRRGKMTIDEAHEWAAEHMKNFPSLFALFACSKMHTAGICNEVTFGAGKYDSEKSISGMLLDLSGYEGSTVNKKGTN